MVGVANKIMINNYIITTLLSKMELFSVILQSLPSKILSTSAFGPEQSSELFEFAKSVLAFASFPFLQSLLAVSSKLASVVVLFVQSATHSVTSGSL